MQSVDGDRKILLIDGNSIINRAFFALSGRSNLTAPDGTPTGAVNTFINTVNKHIEDVQPTHIAALFDRREKTFRHEMFVDYKAKRKGMPDELAVQMPILKDILDAMNISRYELAGYEADDLIGTYATQAEKNGFKVYILSGDKDDFQLITQNTVVVMPVSKSGKASTDRYDVDAFFDRYGIFPGEFITVKALMGDPSDNIPGVRGVGEKTALDLVRKHKTLDEVYAHLSEYPTGLQKKLEEGRQMAYLSYELSRIKKDVPVEDTVESFVAKPPDQDRLSDLFYRLGLRSQLKKAGLENYVPYESTDIAESIAEERIIPSEKPEAIVVSKISDFADRLARFVKDSGKKTIIFDVFETAIPAEESKENRLLVSFSPSEIFLITPEISEEIPGILAKYGYGTQNDRTIAGFSIKNSFKFLKQPLAFTQCFDTEIAGYLLNQIEGMSPSFETLFEHALGIPYPRLPENEGDKRNGDIGQNMTLLETMMETGADNDKNQYECEFDRAIWRVALMHGLVKKQKKQIIESGIEKLTFEIEMPLVLHLDQMERAGFLVDREFLGSMHKEFEKKLEELSRKIYDDAGTDFNILSPKQLGQVLFDRLGLPSGRKNAGGSFSTDSDELSRLADKHPIVSSVLEYRRISKLDSTFVTGLLKGIDPKDDRIHSSFSQAMTTTGRLSSSEPNLQNIPIRTKSGRLIRKAFIAPNGYKLLDADYSQIELRLLAHFSQDENMVRAFLDHEDIHTNTASSIFKIPKESVEPYMRSAAKTVNFSIVYGISDYGLAQDLGVSIQEAHTYIEKYYAQYPQIREYLDSLKNLGYEKGYVETMFGRKRILRELTSPNRNVRMFGERAAMNTPIQGTAADIIKIAMNKVSDDLKRADLDARLILQIHDELIIECADEDISAASVILKNAMESAAVLKVPLISDVRVGASWYECKE